MSCQREPVQNANGGGWGLPLAIFTIVLLTFLI
jgi:hypothetical protein